MKVTLQKSWSDIRQLPGWLSGDVGAKRAREKGELNPSGKGFGAGLAGL